MHIDDALEKKKSSLSAVIELMREMVKLFSFLQSHQLFKRSHVFSFLFFPFSSLKDSSFFLPAYVFPLFYDGRFTEPFPVFHPDS